MGHWHYSRDGVVAWMRGDEGGGEMGGCGGGSSGRGRVLEVVEIDEAFDHAVGIGWVLRWCCGAGDLG